MIKLLTLGTALLSATSHSEVREVRISAISNGPLTPTEQSEYNGFVNSFLNDPAVINHETQERIDDFKHFVFDRLSNSKKREFILISKDPSVTDQNILRIQQSRWVNNAFNDRISHINSINHAIQTGITTLTQNSMPHTPQAYPSTVTQEQKWTLDHLSESTIRQTSYDHYGSMGFQIYQGIVAKLSQQQLNHLVSIDRNPGLTSEARVRDMVKYLIQEERDGRIHTIQEEHNLLQSMNSIAVAKSATSVLEGLRQKAAAEGNTEAYDRWSQQIATLEQKIKYSKDDLYKGDNGWANELGKIVSDPNYAYIAANIDPEFASHLINAAVNSPGGLQGLQASQVNSLLKSSGLWKHLFEMSTMNRMMLGIISGITAFVSGIFIFLTRRMVKFGSSKSIKRFAISLTSIFSITTVALAIMAAIGGV